MSESSSINFPPAASRVKLVGKLTFKGRMLRNRSRTRTTWTECIIAFYSQWTKTVWLQQTCSVVTSCLTCPHCAVLRRFDSLWNGLFFALHHSDFFMFYIYVCIHIRLIYACTCKYVRLCL